MLTTRLITVRGKGIIIAALFLLSSALGAFGLAACDSNSATPTPAASPPTPTDAASTPEDRGKIVFERYCNVCHPGGERGAGPAIIPLLPTLTDNQMATLVRRGKARMPGYSQDTISDDSLSDLITYMRTLK